MSDFENLMRGKRGLIVGVANSRSIAYGIASQLTKAGAQLGLTYQDDILKKRVEPIAEQLGAEVMGPCDVNSQESMDALFLEVEKRWGGLDFLVHAVAFSDKNELMGRYLDTSRDNFLKTMDVSVYSLLELTRRAEKLMSAGGSILTLTYYGAEKWMPHYNVMGVAKAGLEASVRYLSADLGASGVRVNAISAGPVKTLASSGISDFRYIQKWSQLNSPLRREVRIDEIGTGALYLLSDLSSAVTGEVHHIDCGYNVVGMKHPDAPDIAVV